MQKCRTSERHKFNICNTHSEELAGIRQGTAGSESSSTFSYYSEPAKMDLFYENSGFVDIADAGPGIGLVVDSIGFECQRNVGDAGNDDRDSCRLFNLRHLLILSCLDQPFNVTVQCTLHHVRDAFSVKALFSDLFATKARCCNFCLPLYNGSLWLVKCFCLLHQFLSQDNHQLPLETTIASSR